MMSNLQLRVVSASILALIVLTITFWGGFPSRLLVSAVAVAMLIEWISIDRLGIDRRLVVVAFAGLILSLLAMTLAFSAAVAFLLLAAGIVATAIGVRLVGQGNGAVSGLAYAGLSGLSLGYLRGDDHAGLIAILFLFAVVWATDIMAYFVGRTVGGPKLAPAISPGKTISGAVGGAVGGVVAGLVLAVAAGVPGLPLLGVVALLLSVVAQMGDLFESAVKRRNGVKDSGNMIPGHGGLLDRVDGLVAAALALYLVGWFLSGADHPAHGLFAV
jgi:phosphatidate cytidylyltransferase